VHRPPPWVPTTYLLQRRQSGLAARRSLRTPAASGFGNPSPILSDLDSPSSTVLVPLSPVGYERSLALGSGG